MARQLIWKSYGSQPPLSRPISQRPMCICTSEVRSGERCEPAPPSPVCFRRWPNRLDSSLMAGSSQTCRSTLCEGFTLAPPLSHHTWGRRCSCYPMTFPRRPSCRAGGVAFTGWKEEQDSGHGQDPGPAHCDGRSGQRRGARRSPHRVRARRLRHVRFQEGEPNNTIWARSSFDRDRAMEARCRDGRPQ